MGIFDGLKASLDKTKLDAQIRGAILKQQKGKKEEAMQAYEGFWKAGIIRCDYLLPYSTQLLRRGGEENYRLVMDMLKKARRAPDMTPDRLVELYINFSAAEYKLGDISAAITNLENISEGKEYGDLYGVLGYLYVEAGDLDKAIAYNTKGLDYDDEDPIVLDNLGQAYYRVAGDKEKARPYFEKAHELKPGQIDTLYFLSRYDLDEGKTEEAVKKLEKALEGTFGVLNYMGREACEKELARLKAL